MLVTCTVRVQLYSGNRLMLTFDITCVLLLEVNNAPETSEVFG